MSISYMHSQKEKAQMMHMRKKKVMEWQKTPAYAKVGTLHKARKFNRGRPKIFAQ